MFGCPSMLLPVTHIWKRYEIHTLNVNNSSIGVKNLTILSQYNTSLFDVHIWKNQYHLTTTILSLPVPFAQIFEQLFEQSVLWQAKCKYGRMEKIARYPKFLYTKFTLHQIVFLQMWHSTLVTKQNIQSHKLFVYKNIFDKDRKKKCDVKIFIIGNV